jgi:hypothetical protein
MSRDGSITETFGDGEHLFRLAIGQLRELDDYNDGPPLRWRRLAEGDWYVRDVRDVLRAGLTGGGMVSLEAIVKVNRELDAAQAKQKPVNAPCGDDEYALSLTTKDLEEIERQVGCGIMAVLRRLHKSEYLTKDVLAVLEVALLRAGVDEKRAAILAERVCSEGLHVGALIAKAAMAELPKYWEPLVSCAERVLRVGLHGYQGESLGKSKAGTEKKPSRSRARKSASASSTETEPS